MGFPFRSEKLIRYLTGRYQLGGVFPNDGYISGTPKNVCSDFGTGNVGTGLDALFTFSFPATSLRKNKDNFRAFLCGAFGSNDDNKRLTVDFGGTNLVDTGLVDIDGFGYLVTVFGIRVDSTHINLETTIMMGNVNIDSAGGIASAGMKVISANANFLAVNDMDTNSNDLVLKGESATATNDNVTCNIAIIDLVRF